MPQDNKYMDMKVHRVEYLASASGHNEQGPAVIITIRPDMPKSFRPHNIAMSADQAARLRDDLNRLFEDSILLKPKPKRRRKRNDQ